MVTFTSLNELKMTNKALEDLKKAYPELFVKFLDAVNLTRAFQFKYHYLISLILNEDPGQDKPNFVYGSVLRLYKREVQKIKDDVDFHVLEQFFIENKNMDSTKICLLALGMTPDSLVGPSFFK
jgi:hypothetical protein